MKSINVQKQETEQNPSTQRNKKKVPPRYIVLLKTSGKEKILKKVRKRKGKESYSGTRQPLPQEPCKRKSHKAACKLWKRKEST